MNDPQEQIRQVYDVSLTLPRHSGMFSTRDLPRNGIYLFFEADESAYIDGMAVDRIVRVGTHRVDGRLGQRLRNHYRGNCRGNVFRRHLGSALVSTGRVSGMDQAIIADSRVRPPELETAISDDLHARFTFVCFQVDHAAERSRFEAGLIELLAQHPLAPPSTTWLGLGAVRSEIRSSGLWNTQHIGSPPISETDLLAPTRSPTVDVRDVHEQQSMRSQQVLSPL